MARRPDRPSSPPQARYAGSPDRAGFADKPRPAAKPYKAGSSKPGASRPTESPVKAAAPSVAPSRPAHIEKPVAARPAVARPARVEKPGVTKIETPGGALWLWGRHAVEAALLNPERTVIRLLVTPEAQDTFEPGGTVLPEVVDRAVIDSLLGATTVHQGIALLVRPLPDVGVEDIIRLVEDRKSAVIVVLDQVTDPHNVGAVLRTAAAFGAVALLVQDRHTPDESGVLAKAASGALERVTVARVSNLVRALDTLRASGFWVAGLAADGTSTLASAKLSGKVVLTLGSEGEGLRRLTREHCDLIVRLPMAPGGMESLNVSVAAAIALYEVSREGLE